MNVCKGNVEIKKNQWVNCKLLEVYHLTRL